MIYIFAQNQRNFNCKGFFCPLMFHLHHISKLPMNKLAVLNCSPMSETAGCVSFGTNGLRPRS